MPLVLVSQAAVLCAQVGHMLLQLKDAPLLPLQQRLLGLYDLIQLLQIARCLRRILGPAVHRLLIQLTDLSQILPLFSRSRRAVIYERCARPALGHASVKH